MSLLQKQEIEDLIRAPNALLKNFDPLSLNSTKSPVRAASLDLTLGSIYLPGKKSCLNDKIQSRDHHILKEGECAVLKTLETLSMPTNVGAIGFPPSTEISLSGVLTTNPGHIDPGYEGPLHLTVINMGKKDFSLRKGDRIMRLLLFSTSGKDTGLRNVAADPINRALLNRLAKDFLNIEKRARNAANNAVTRGQILGCVDKFEPISG